MQAGQLVQVDRPEVVWRAPASEFVARFIDLETVVDAAASRGQARTALGTFPLHGLSDGPHRVVVLAGAARLAVDGQAPAPATPDEPGSPARPRSVPADVVARRFAGDHLVVRARTDDGVELAVPVWDAPGPSVGQRVRVAIDPEGLHVLPGEAAARASPCALRVCSAGSRAPPAPQREVRTGRGG